MLQDFSKPKTTSNHTLLKIVLLAILLVVLFFASLSVYAFSKINRPLTYFSNPKTVQVEKGQSLKQIADILQNKGVVSSSFIFNYYVRAERASSDIQAGTYLLDSSMTMPEILDRLTRGKVQRDEKRLTFLEGKTVRDYANFLEERGVMKADAFLKAEKNFSDSGKYNFLSDMPAGHDLEGYLFPDTYNLKQETTPEEVVDMMLRNFGRKLDAELRQEISRQKKTIFEIITMASLIEGEVGRPEGAEASELQKLTEERRLVATVFYNRLNANYALESDATLSYITQKKSRQASLEDTKIDSPYNTYRNRGLPPGPINNPSLDSIKAAVYPAQSDYFYFLSKPSGEAVFARTLAEHNANKAEYLK